MERIIPDKHGGSRLGRVVRALGSLQLAIVLLLILAIAIAAATVQEADHGREYAQWFVYHSAWFLALLAFLGVNILCAALSRWPWQRHQTGFLLTHAGLLVLLTGALQTYFGGKEGHVTLTVGESTTKMVVPFRSQLSASWTARSDEASCEFVFEPGPLDWRGGKSLALGDLDGVGLRVLRYLAQEKAALVEATLGGETRTVWLQRNHPALGTRMVSFPEGSLRLRFSQAQEPLGFELSLVKFQRDRNPGGAGDAGFSSLVRVTGASGVGEERFISMNEPLTHNRLTFYQAGFSDGHEGAESSTFSVAYDPGRPFKYAGSLMICLGIAVMFYMRAYFFKKAPCPDHVTQVPAPASERSEGAGSARGERSLTFSQ